MVLDFFSDIFGSSSSGFRHRRPINFLWVSGFRKLVHKQGIAWMRAINRHVNVNMSDLKSIKFNQNNETSVVVRVVDGRTIKQKFLEQDFCLYVDFPFKQFVQYIIRSLESYTRVLPTLKNYPTRVNLPEWSIDVLKLLG